MAACLRPWKDEYQLLCSIDSVSGEMKSISPFRVPSNCAIEDQTATSIESHFKVIETINDYQESKAFRARLSGAISSFWSVEANCSALDSAKVNSKDIFGYYSLLFTKSRVVVNSCTLSSLPLTKEAERAVRNGKFRDLYGDMIVVGYITGGEAEAVLRVTSFKEDRRDSIRKALRVALQDNDSRKNQVEVVVNGGQNAALTVATGSATSGGAAAEAARGQDDLHALQDATTTLLSRRTGVTHQDQLHNPNNFPQLLRQLTKAAENTGVKISALCYRIELFSQVSEDLLGFARTVVDENVNTLQKQFAQAQFVYNSCEAHLAQGAASSTSEDIAREFRKLQQDACAAMQRFARFKGYRDVGQLPAHDSARTIGSELVQRFDDLCEKLRVAEVRAEAQQQLEKAVRARRLVELPSIKGYQDENALGWLSGQPSVSFPSTPRLKTPPLLVGPPSVTGPSVSQPTSYTDGVLHGRLISGRNFATSGVMAIRRFLVVKLDGKQITSPNVAVNKGSGMFLWHFEFSLEVTAKLLSEDASLVLEVWDKNTLRSDKCLGAVNVPLRLACGQAAVLGGQSLAALVADADRSKPTWYPVEKVDVGKYKCRGELQLSLRFSTDLTSLQGPEVSLSSGSDGLASIAMSPLTNNLPTRLACLPHPQQYQSADANPTYPTICAMGTPAFGIPQATMGMAVPPSPGWQFSPAAAVGPAVETTVATVTLRQGPMFTGSAYTDPDVRSAAPQSWSPLGPGLASPAPDQKAPSAQNARDECCESSSYEDEGQPSTTDGKGIRPVETETNSVVQMVARSSTAAPSAVVNVAPSTDPGLVEPGEAAQERQQVKQTKRKRRGGFIGLLVRLTVTGAVLGSAGAAAVVVSRNRFGVDLVAESRRLAIEYGTIAQRASVTWSRQGGSAVRAWTSKLVDKVRRRSRGGVQGAPDNRVGLESSPEVVGEQQ